MYHLLDLLLKFGIFVATASVAPTWSCIRRQEEILPKCINCAIMYMGRPVGEIEQEVGGVMSTLAALCCAFNIHLEGAANTEMERVWKKIDVIREKHKNKLCNIKSALPSILEAGTDKI